MDVRASYDAVARAYAAQLGGELDGKPVDRALLDAFAELTRAGTVADVGCGPGHVTRYLAARHPAVVGLDLSPRMIAVAAEGGPGPAFVVGSMLALPVADGAWAGAVALYSIIHLDAAGRAAACRELARAVRPGGWLLAAFHVDGPGVAAGANVHHDELLGERVDLDFHYLDPAEVAGDLAAAGWTVMATTTRLPWPGAEHPSRRAYLLARRH